MEPKDLDFTIMQGIESVKEFTPKDESGASYDMTGSSVKLKARRDSGDVILDGTLLNGGLSVAFTFTDSFTSTKEDFEYVIYEIGTGSQLNYLFEGTLEIRAEFDFSNSIDALIDNLKPEGVLLNNSFIVQQIKFWKLYLHPLVTPAIPEEDIEDDTSWPPLVNYLIAYLVIHDFLKKYARKSFSDMFGNGESDADGAQIKKIETGPTNVEYYDSAKAITSMFKANSDGSTAFDGLVSEICQLSKRLRIYLPMCGRLSQDVILPKYYYREKPSTMSLILNKYYG